MVERRASLDTPPASTACARSESDVDRSRGWSVLEGSVVVIAAARVAGARVTRRIAGGAVCPKAKQQTVSIAQDRVSWRLFRFVRSGDHSFDATERQSSQELKSWWSA